MSDDVHEWVSFEHDDCTYVFDLTFLTSNYMCIYGQGCPGILDAPAPQLHQGCCSFGAHFVDDEDRDHVADLAGRLGPDEWEYAQRAEELGGPIQRNEDGDWMTHVVDGACIFLNRPGFSKGPGCALHQGALARDERPLDWKPAVCWQVPLRLEQQVDDNEHVTWVLREWKRRDWGEGGEDFHWWCTEHPMAFVADRAVYRTMADELIELVGEEPYVRLCELIETRAPETYAIHPALKTEPSATDE